MIDFEAVDAIDSGRKSVAVSPVVEGALQQLGARLRTARLRRKETVASTAERIGVSVSTYKRLEAGAEGVAVGAYFEALNLFGFASQLYALADPALDRQGEAHDQMNRSKRGVR